MKRTLQHLLVMAGLLLASSEVFAQEWEERVVNGDFEGSDFSSFAIKPKNEDIRNLEANDIVVDDENANNHYVKIVPTNKQDALFYIKIGDALSEGDRIIVSMHAKVKNSDVGRICFQAHGEADEYKGSLMEKSISKLWGFFNYDGVVSADQNGCKTIAICLNTRGAAKNELYLDDIKVMVMRDTPIKFANTKVKEICVQNWDTNGDGELSTGEAAVVKVREGFDPQFGNYFFYYKEDITSFDELQYFIGLDKIGGFDDCVNLTSIVIPNSVRIINSGAFERCISLTSIDIPNSVEYIGSRSFDGCSSLTSIELPNSLLGIGRIIEGNSEEVGGGTFRGCESLTSIVIPSQVKTLDSNLFEGCSSLTSLTIPKSVKQIFGNPVPGCSSLTSLNVEEGNTVYDSRDNCNAIINTSSNELLAGCKNTVIPNSVTSIGGSAFSGCSGLTSISIPNSITSIGGSAFYGCTGLTSLTIGNGVSKIEYGTFEGCNNLASVVIHCKEIGNWFSSFTSIEEIVIGDEVTSIDYYAFRNCSGLASIKVDSCNTVYDSRNNCNAIIETETNELITGCMNTAIPNSVTSIGIAAFEGCSHLTSIMIPNSVTRIGNFAFYGCGGLTSVEIPNSVTNIGSGAFYWCSGLTSIVVDEGNMVYDSRDNCNAIIKTETNELITGCMNTVIPNSVTRIGNNAFYGCGGLTSVGIPNSVTSIGGGAFAGCTGLTSFTIPSSVMSIGYDAFLNTGWYNDQPEGILYHDNWLLGCKYMVYSASDIIEIPEDTRGIADLALGDRFGLTSLTIPSSVIAIGTGAFSRCSGLTSIVVDEGNMVYDSRDNCNAIIKTETNELITGCMNTAIPNSVTSIGIAAFEGCSHLTSIMIPNNITSIERGAFYECGSLTEVHSLIEQPFAIDKSVFQYYQYGLLSFTSATLYVPVGTKEKYEATEGWNLFTNIVEMEPTKPGDVNGDSAIDVADIASVIDCMSGSAGIQPASADVNGDGVVDVADIATIIDMMAGK